MQASPKVAAWAALSIAACAGPDLDRLEAASRCESEDDLRLCAGFEGVLDAELVELGDGDAADVAIDETLAFRGRGSMRATTAPDGRGAAQVYHTGEAPGVPPLDWVRVFVRTPEPTALDAEVMWLLSNEEPYYGVIVSVLDGGRVALRSWSEPDFYDVTTSSRLEADRWICLEARVSPSEPIGLWLDGEPVPGIEPPGTAVATGLLVTHIGLYRTVSSGSPVSMWYDELALGDERVGCDR